MRKNTSRGEFDDVETGGRVPWRTIGPQAECNVLAELPLRKGGGGREKQNTFHIWGGGGRRPRHVSAATVAPISGEVAATRRKYWLDFRGRCRSCTARGGLPSKIPFRFSVFFFFWTPIDQPGAATVPLHDQANGI